MHNLPQRSRKLALVEGTLAGASFGTAAIFIRLIKLVDGINVYSIAFWRLIIAICALGIVAFASRKMSKFFKMRENFRKIIVLGFLLGLHFILFVSAVGDTTILNATVLVNTTPIFSMILSLLSLR